MKSSALLVLVTLACGSAVCAQISDFQGTDFSKADSVAELYAAHPLKDLKGLADKLTAPFLTDQEKFRAIFKWVCNNIEVDYSLVAQNKRKRAQLHRDKLNNWNNKFNRMVFETLMSQRKTICTGYAYLILELAFHAGLSCEIVNGYAKPGGIQTNGPRTVNHSWNLIRLNNKKYFCDATWSSGIFNLSTQQFRKKYNDRYFLADPLVFAQDHEVTHEIVSKDGIP
jgi:transglutaminase/protease-like cytokinesis protein 3